MIRKRMIKPPFGFVNAAHRSLLLVPYAVLVACWKLVVTGPSCGHDFDFHLLSWMEAAQQWQHGVFYPHWVASANFGAGEPRFVFYPPLSWMLGAALGFIAGWNLAPLLFTALALLGCGIGMHLLAREWLPLDLSARAAALYMVSPYMGFVVYERAAYGELLAGAFVPLVLLFALREKSSVVLLAVAFAAVWLANAPAGVMAGYTLAFVTVVAAIAEKQWRLVFRAAAGALLGLGLAAFYLVPAAYERRWVQIERAVGPGMRIEDSFLFGHSGEAYHDQVLGTASWIAVFMLAIAMASGAILLWRSQRGQLVSEYRRCRQVSIPLMALLPLILVLLLPISARLWAHAPELAFLQFPWRWLLICGMAYALLAAAVLRRRLAIVGGLLPLIFIGAVQPQWFYQPCDDEDAVAAQVNGFKTRAGVEGTDEYVSRDVDNGAIQKGLPEVRLLSRPDADAVDSSVAMNPQWSPEARDEVQPQLEQLKIHQWDEEHKTFQIKAEAPGFAVLRLMDYPAWEVRVNGVSASQRPHRDDGLLTVPVAAGVSQIDITYRATKDVWLGRILSLMALSATLLAGLADRRKPGYGQVS